MKILAITIRERGAVPRSMAKQHRQASRQAYQEIAEQHHRENTPNRFTKQHGQAAGYRKRKGEDLQFGTKAFWGSYTGRKLRKFGHTLPLVWSGQTRDRARLATIQVTTNRGQLRYSVNALNYNPWARDEFTTLTAPEVQALGQTWETVYARFFDRDMDQGMRFV